MNTKIQLIFPEGGSKLSSSGILPPVGIISIATYIKNKMPKIEIELFDGEIIKQKEIEKKICAKIIGISTTGANYNNTLKIAKKAKKKGALIILGGSHATVKHKEILEKNKYIDAVVRGDGEITFYKYIKAIFNNNINDLKKINNLSFRLNNKIIINSPTCAINLINLNKLPLPDYSLLGDTLKKYEINFENSKYKKSGFTKFISIESQKGCSKAKILSKNKGRCSFCARIDLGLRRLNPNEFWKRIIKIHNNNSKTLIWDISDNFIGKLSKDDVWLKELAKSKPKTLKNKVYFKIFARSDNLDIETIKLIKEIGVSEIFIGIESGDQNKLDLINKGTTIKDNINAIRNLKKYNIKVYISLVYGLPKEDKHSLKKTYQHTKKLIEIGNITDIGARVLFPLAGCIDHQKLIIKLKNKHKISLANKITNCDYYNPYKLQKLWVKYLTNTSSKEINIYHKKIMKLAKIKNIKINNTKRLFLNKK